MKKILLLSLLLLVITGCGNATKKEEYVCEMTDDTTGEKTELVYVVENELATGFTSTSVVPLESTDLGDKSKEEIDEYIKMMKSFMEPSLGEGGSMEIEVKDGSLVTRVTASAPEGDETKIDEVIKGIETVGGTCKKK